jgi:inactivated superfamily I helicase
MAKLSAPIPSFKPGDKVALSTVHLNVPGKTRKLKEKWIAPLLVKEVMADGRALRRTSPLCGRSTT